MSTWTRSTPNSKTFRRGSMPSPRPWGRRRERLGLRDGRDPETVAVLAVVVAHGQGRSQEFPDYGGTTDVGATFSVLEAAGMPGISPEWQWFLLILANGVMLVALLLHDDGDST